MIRATTMGEALFKAAAGRKDKLALRIKGGQERALVRENDTATRVAEFKKREAEKAATPKP